MLENLVMLEHSRDGLEFHKYIIVNLQQMCHNGARPELMQKQTLE